MRATIIALFICLSLVVTAAAQSPVKFGVKGGLALADMTGDGWDDIEASLEVTADNSFKAGFAGGAFFEMPLGASGLALHPEVLFVMKGSKADLTSTEDASVTVTTKIKQTYLEVPVLLKYNIPTQGQISPNLFAGPYAAFKMSSKIEFEDVPAAAADELTSGDIENAKSVDFGVAFGGGVDFAVGPKSKLTLDVRYSLGLTDAFDDDNGEDDDKIYLTDDQEKGLKFKNSDIRFMVGFMF